MHRYVLALLIVASPFSAFAAELPKEGSYDYTSCWSGVNNVITFSKTHTASSFEMTGASRSNPPGGIFDKNTFRCVGMNASLRAGPGCLNNNSASISGASAGVRSPRGAEEDRSRLDPGCGRQGSNAVVARCKSRDTDQSSFVPRRLFRRLADRPPRI